MKLVRAKIGQEGVIEDIKIRERHDGGRSKNGPVFFFVRFPTSG